MCSGHTVVSLRGTTDDGPRTTTLFFATDLEVRRVLKIYECFEDIKNPRDSKGVVCGPWSVVCGLSSFPILRHQFLP